jgi:hypothetical protein
VRKPERCGANNIRGQQRQQNVEAENRNDCLSLYGTSRAERETNRRRQSYYDI